MKILSWNVNGIRACANKGFLDWFKGEAADIVCLQEIKATPEQLDDELRNPLKYHAIWNPAEKKGYSGTVIFSKKEPIEVSFKIGIEELDKEGRVIVAKFPKFTLVNCYFPNSKRDHSRLPLKIEFCQKFLKEMQKRRKKGENLVMCADWNIAHQEIDLKNPKTNKKNAGFLPEERAWMSEFIEAGYFDTFRHFEPGGDHYTWWSYRPGVREKNVGWRLDYFMMNDEAKDRLKNAYNQPQVYGSDHCPVAIELKR